MTNANFNPDISFVINVPDRCKAHTNCTAGGLSDPIAPKKKIQNFEWERCDGELIFTKAPSHLGQQATQNFNTSP